MYNKRQTSSFGNLVRTIHDNTPEKPFNPLKTYYASIFYGSSSKLVKYEAKFRSEAEAYFKEIARLKHGSIEVISVFK